MTEPRLPGSSGSVIARADHAPGSRRPASIRNASLQPDQPETSRTRTRYVAHLPAAQRTPRCGHRDLRIAIPLVGRGQDGLEAGRFGRLDLVAELHEPGMGGADLPRQARLLGPVREDAVGELGAESLDDERHPLTAPEEIPDTIWRWKNRNTISGGMVIRSTSAKSRCQRVLNWLWKLNNVSWTVAFSVPGRK